MRLLIFNIRAGVEMEREGFLKSGSNDLLRSVRSQMCGSEHLLVLNPDDPMIADAWPMGN